VPLTRAELRDLGAHVGHALGRSDVRLMNERLQRDPQDLVRYLEELEKDKFGTDKSSS